MGAFFREARPHAPNRAHHRFNRTGRGRRFGPPGRSAGSQGDYLTADPMAQNELLTNSINGHVYESLVMRGKKLEILPGLAESWKQTGPTTWVFNLRKGVKFHDGSDFTADDVVFSILRLQGKTQLRSERRGHAEEDRPVHGRAHHAGAEPGDARDARQ
jgi:ABC-type transport system substrate-binding protein